MTEIHYIIGNNLKSLNYFAKKYSGCTALEMLELIQKDPEFSVSRSERQGDLFYRIRHKNAMGN